MLVLHTVEIVVPGAHDWQLVLKLPVLGSRQIGVDQIMVRAVRVLRSAGITVPEHTHLRYVGLVTIGPAA